MFCSKCGTKLSDDAKFCHVCGNACYENGNMVNASANVQADADNTESTVHREANYSRQRRTRSKSGILAFVLLLGISAAALYFYLLTSGFFLALSTDKYIDIIGTDSSSAYEQISATLKENDNIEHETIGNMDTGIEVYDGHFSGDKHIAVEASISQGVDDKIYSVKIAYASPRDLNETNEDWSMEESEEKIKKTYKTLCSHFDKKYEKKYENCWIKDGIYIELDYVDWLSYLKLNIYSESCYDDMINTYLADIYISAYQYVDAKYSEYLGQGQNILPTATVDELIAYGFLEPPDSEFLNALNDNIDITSSFNIGGVTVNGVTCNVNGKTYSYSGN